VGFEGPSYVDKHIGFRILLAIQKISFAIDSNNTFEGTARLVDEDKDPELAAVVSKLMNAKYGWNEGLIVELASP
jgi:hypothetical protein